MLLRLLSYVWLILTLVLLLKPGLGYEQVLFFQHEDKLAHFILFMNLAYLWQKEFQRILGYNFKASVRVSAYFTIALSGLTEIAQHYIPYRGMDWIDFGFNLGGVTIGLIFALYLEKRAATV